MHLKGCSRLEILNWLLLLSPGMPGGGEGWDDIKAMSSAATVLLLRVHTEINRGAKEKRKKKCPSHGILKNAKSWGNRQIICGIVIKLNDPSTPPTPFAFSSLSCNAWLNLILHFIIRLYGIFKCLETVEKSGKVGGETDGEKPFKENQSMAGSAAKLNGVKFSSWAADLCYN